MRPFFEICPVTCAKSCEMCKTIDSCSNCDLFKSSIVGKHTELKARSSQKHVSVTTLDDSVLIEVDGMTITVDKNLNVIVSPK